MIAISGPINFYSTIREINAKLPAEQRIKVWPGQPPLDWSTIRTKPGLKRIGNPVVEQRDKFAAELIERQLLAKNKKALVIYGIRRLFDEPSRV